MTGDASLPPRGKLNLHKKNQTETALCMSILLSALIATTAYAQTSTPADRAFEKLQSLAGTWEGQDERGPARTVFHISISRTVIMETLTAAGMPSMMTLYTLDGNAIAIVHYCASNNQPRLRAVPGAGPLKELLFSFIDAGNLPNPETGHEHKLVIHFEDDEHISETWTWHENGKDFDQTFHFCKRLRPSDRQAPVKR
jgi:hypothetical protein